MDHQPGQSEFGAQIIHLNGEVVVVVSGEIDVACSEAFLECLLSAAEEAPHLIVDISDVSFIDSSGLTALLAAQKYLRSAHGWLMVRSPQDQVRQVIRLTGLNEMLPVDRRKSN